MSSSGGHSNFGDGDLKYARGVSARPTPSPRPLRLIEVITLTHVIVLILSTTWAFGGQADWIAMPLAWWGSLGALITLTALQDRDAWRDGWMRPIHWLWPMLAFNVIVLVAALNPSLRELKLGTETVLSVQGGNPRLPSSARPELAWRALWLFDAVWITCFNVALIIRQRRALRLLLVIAVGNAVLLALFGTVQKLTQAKGLFFGAVPSPQTHFFASFIYHNHWGAFAVLMLAACLGLIWHYGRRREARDFFHTPASAGIVLLLLIAATVPLSASRSATVLAIALLGAAFLHGIARLVQRRRRFRESIAPPLLGAVAALAVGLAAIWYVARDTITLRLAKTREQVAEMKARGGIGDRAELYRDTWRMAKDKLWFGWGMASYPHVFQRYNRQESVDGLPAFYRDAHSDWLQSLAEHGLVGSALLGLAALLPLLRLRPRHFTSPVPGYLLAGCALIVLYAWVEFPFGNVAVVLLWWLCFFCAVQYARLQDRDNPGRAGSNPPMPMSATGG